MDTRGLRFLYCLGCLCLGSGAALANPQGGVVAAGQASISSSGTVLTIDQATSRAVIDWRSFDIAAGESTVFNQPSSSSLALNRIHSQDPSRISGSLTANGHVILVNPNGVFFGKGSHVDVGGLTATSAGIRNEDFMSGAGTLDFSQPGSATAKIVNEGTITAKDAGLVNLVAPQVENHGTISARLGRANLGSGEIFTLDLANDGLLQVGVSKSALPGQSVTNTGAISATGGQVHITAAAARDVVDSLITNTGVIEAKTLGASKGTVRLYAEGSNAVAGNATQDKGAKSGTSTVINSGTIDVSAQDGQGGTAEVLADHIWLEGQSSIDASGAAGGGTIRVGGDYRGEGGTPAARAVYVGKDARINASATSAGDAGDVTLWADKNMYYYGTILSEGGALSGDGGFVEVSGKDHLEYRGFVSTLAANGETGLLFLDPADIIIASGSGDGAADGTTTFMGAATAGTVLDSDAGPSTIYESELEGIAATTSISVAATNSITINDLADGTLSFGQTGARTAGFTAGAGGITMLDLTDTLATAGGHMSFTTTNGGGVTLGNLTASGGNITLNVAGTSSVSGVISGSGNVTKTGTGTLTLSGLNTYTGRTIITGGTLSAGLLANGGVASNIGQSTNAATNLSISSTGVLEYTGGSVTIDRNYALTNNQNGTFSVTNAGTNLTLTGASTATSGRLVKTGAGTLTLTGANLHTGLTTVSAGTLAYGADNVLSSGGVTVSGGTLNLGAYSDTVGAVTLSGGGTITSTTGVLTGTSYAMQDGTVSAILAGTGNLTKSSTGTVTLTRDNTYTGITTLSAGTLSVSSIGNGGVAGNLGQASNAAGNLVFNAGTLQYTGATASTDRNFTLNTGTTNTFDITNAGTNLTLAGASTATTGRLVKTGAGTLTLAGANLYTNTTTVNAGTLAYGIDNALATGNVTLAGGILDIGGYSDTIGTLTLSGGTLTGTTGVFSPTTTALQSGTVSAILGGTTGVTKTTAGTVTLTRQNTYTGTTAISDGTLALGADNVLPDTEAISVSSSGWLDIGSYSDTVGTVTVGNGTTGGITGTTGVLTGSAYTLQQGTISAILGGTAALLKNGNNNATITSANTYSGGTTITNNGTLTVTNSSGLGTGGVTLTDGALELASDTPLTLANSVNITNTAAVKSGRLTPGAGLAHTIGTLTTTAGTLTTSVGANVTSGTATFNFSGLTPANNPTFAVSAGAQLGIGALDDGGVARGITKTGLGSISFNAAPASWAAANAFTLNNGTAFLGADNVFGAATLTNVIVNSNVADRTALLDLNGYDMTIRNLTFGGTGGTSTSTNSVRTSGGLLTLDGTVTVSASGNPLGATLEGFVDLGTAGSRTFSIGNSSNADADLTISAVISGAGSVEKTGAGTLVLSGQNTYAGSTDITVGTLVASGGDALPDTTRVILANAASAILQLSNDETIGGLSGGGATGGNVVLGANTLTTGDGADTIYDGIISGTGGLRKAGAGTFTLSRASTYSGGTFVDAGTLKLGAAERIADLSALTVASGATFDMNGHSETLAALASAGTVSMGTGATLTTAGAQSFTGVVTGNNATLASTGGGDITANNAANDFTGTLAVSTTGAAAVRDANSLTLGAVSAGTFSAFALGGNMVVNNLIQTTGTSGTPLLLSSTGSFTNNAGASALSTGAGGRWLVYADSPLTGSRGGLSYDFKQYNAAYGASVLGTGNGFIYALAPTITPGLTGTTSKTYDGTTAAALLSGNFTQAGAIDGDTVTLGPPSPGAYADANAGTGKTVTASGITISGATNGSATVYGYALSTDTAAAAIGAIDKANLTVSTSDVTKTYDGTTAAAGTAIVTAGTLYNNASNGGALDALSGGTFLFTDPNVGTGKTVTVSGVTVLDGNGGNNYNVAYANNLNSSIIDAASALQESFPVANIVSSAVPAATASRQQSATGGSGSQQVIVLLDAAPATGGAATAPLLEISPELAATGVVEEDQALVPVTEEPAQPRRPRKKKIR